MRGRGCTAQGGEVFWVGWLYALERCAAKARKLPLLHTTNSVIMQTAANCYWEKLWKIRGDPTKCNAQAARCTGEVAKRIGIMPQSMVQPMSFHLIYMHFALHR